MERDLLPKHSMYGISMPTFTFETTPICKCGSPMFVSGRTLVHGQNTVSNEEQTKHAEDLPFTMD